MEIRVFYYIHLMKFIKWFFIGLLSLVVLLEAALYLTGNGYVNKVLAMTIFSGKMGPEIDELLLFERHEVKNGYPQPWPISANYQKGEIPASIRSEIEKYQTVSFLVVKEDSLCYELYNEGYGDSSYVNSFSMAKSIHSILIGCALKDKLIQSIDQPVADFIPEFKTGGKEKITIRHLLTMGSGLDFKEEYVSPLAWPAEAYYGPDVNKLTLKAAVAEEPGVKWIYKGGDTQLLGIILKKVLGEKSIATYASEKLWQPIGAEHPAYWSTDEVGMEKVSCCFYTNARDYARLAKLYLQFGNWNGKQIVDSDYVKHSIQTAPLIDKDGKQIDKYGFQWWLMQYNNHPVFYMRGIKGQYVFAIPDYHMVVVRLGHKRAPKAGDELPADIFVYLDAAFAVTGSK